MSLSQVELEARISDIELGHPQRTYAGPAHNLSEFLNEIESNCQAVNVPRVQWADIALHFMTNEIRQIMCEYKERIQNTEEIQDNELWDAFKGVMQELHARAVEASNASSDPNSNTFAEAAAGGIAIAGVTYAVGPAVALGALNIVGFTSSGVLAGSAAATAQSIIYGGSTTGIFSAMQAIAATGVVASAPVLALGAGVVGIAAAGIYLARNLPRRD